MKRVLQQPTYSKTALYTEGKMGCQHVSMQIGQPTHENHTFLTVAQLCTRCPQQKYK